MNMPAIITDKKVRDEVKEKIEVVMAIFVLTGFVYKKIKDKKEVQDEDN